MRTSIYDFVGVVIAIFICIVIFIGVVKAKLGGRNFSSRDNLKWCAYLVAWAAVAPLLYWWGSPTKISFADAYLLRVTAAGWTFVLMAYAAIAGLALGILWTAGRRR